MSVETEIKEPTTTGVCFVAFEGNRFLTEVRTKPGPPIIKK